jgi:hypothetical protein
MSDEERAALGTATAASETQRLAGMAEKSAEFLEKGGQLYVQAAE